MINIKTPQEIIKMKKAGKVVAQVHALFAKIVQPGISLLELDKQAHDLIIAQGATPSFLKHEGFLASICSAVNDTVVHGIPTNYILQEGDIVSLDVGACYQGYHGDGAWSYKVGTITSNRQKLLDVTKKSLYKALAILQDGIHVGDIGAVISQYVFKHNMEIPRCFTGHGIGTKLHESPAVHNVGKKGTGPILKSGMTIAIEPIVHYGAKEIKIDDDGWTARTVDQSDGAHYEHTVLITKKGYVILTSLDQKEIING